MDYDLSRIDYTICGITYPDTLKIMPAAGANLLQKIVVGDKNGVLQCLSIKDEEPVVIFKTLPGKPITSVQLASIVGSQIDKIFAASGNEVKGYTKKGKVFVCLETSLSETITSMCVIGGDLMLCSGRTVTYYRDLQELHSYTCADRVLDIAAFATPNSTRVRLLVLVANKGAVLLENGQVISHSAVSSGPSRLVVPLSLSPADIAALYGAADGSIGLIAYGESGLTSKCLVEGRGLGSVMCMGFLSNNGGTHLAVGRHDGSIQLYLLNLDNLTEKPRLKYTYFCGEPITSVVGGSVGTDDNELIASTFSGRIFALRSRRFVTGNIPMGNIPQDALALRRTKLEAEIARLEKQTANEREKYQKSTRSLHAGLSAPPLLDVHCELSGATREGWQEARITSSVSLDLLFIYCNKKLNMETDNAAVLSVCSSQGSSEDLMATVRCQAGTRRLWIRMRYAAGSEGRESVTVLLYALPAGAPRVARHITLRLPALPYYSVHEDPDSNISKLHWSELRISGSFSVAEITSWLVEVLPGDLPRPATNVSFTRCHSLLRTFLTCQYQRGLAVFKSDDVSAIAIIKEVMSNCSVKKIIRLEISCDVPTDCCVKAFLNLEDIYQSEYKIFKDIELHKYIDSLDLDDNIVNGEEPVLCEDYMRVYKLNEEKIQESYFYELVGVVENWHKDWHSLSLYNEDVSKIKQLQAALKTCQIDTIVKLLSSD